MRRGIVLLLVVGVLGVLALLATLFVAMAQLERKASQRRVHATQAFLLARSGIEDGLARMAAGQDAEFVQNRYAGEDWNANGTLDPVEQASESYRSGLLDRDACPLAQAQRPSFWKSGAGGPGLTRVDGLGRGRSGALWTDGQYSLKILTGGLFVNGGDPAQPAAEGYNVMLRRMLGILAREVGGAVTQTDGWNLIDRRPSRGWTSFGEIRQRALGGSQAKLDALKPYLALEAWTDKRVIAPNAMPPLSGRSYSSWGDLRLDRIRPGSTSTRAPGFERMPRSGGRVVGRAPVELDWARTRRPVLTALIEGLEGLYLDERTARLIPPTNPPAYLFETAPWTVYAADPLTDLCGTLRTLTMTPARTQTAVSAILGSAADLSTWQRFHTFCSNLIPFTAPTTAEVQALKDILKANFNPNSDLNKFNPGKTTWKLVDKSDLTAYSTEFSLGPVQPRRIESLGRVLAPSGRVLAQRLLEVTASPYGVVRLASQREFVCEDLGSLDFAGDEKDPRLPGFSVNGAPGFLTESKGLDPTWGHVLDTTGLSPAANYSAAAGNWMDGLGRGASLQTYPEPCYDTTPNPTTPPTFPDPTGTRLSINPADYAGSLQLATIETPKDSWYTVPAATREMTMLARFDDGFDLDDWEATYPAGTLCIPGSRQGTTAELGLGCWCSDASLKLNTLYPDGAYSEVFRVPSYFDKSNVHGLHGTMSFWVKTAYDLPHPPANQYGSAAAWRSHAFVMRSNPLHEEQQFFFVGDGHGDPSSRPWSLMLALEVGKDSVDTQTPPPTSQEAMFYSGRRTTPHAWQLITVAWDFLSPDGDSVGEFVLDNGAGTATASAEGYFGSKASLWPAATDITADSGTILHRMALGAQGRALAWQYQGVVPWPTNGVAPGADATLDELAVWDFGGAFLTADLASATAVSNSLGVVAAPADALGAPNTIASQRFQAGRYHRGSTPPPVAGLPFEQDPDAAWVSGPVRLPAGARIRELRWTWLTAPGLSRDFAEVELLKPDLSGHLWREASSRSVLQPGWRPPPLSTLQSWRLDEAPGGPFRIRVDFRRILPVVPLPLTPILESPVFDDLTVLYLPSGGPRLLSYGEP